MPHVPRPHTYTLSPVPGISPQSGTLVTSDGTALTCDDRPESAVCIAGTARSPGVAQSAGLDRCLRTCVHDHTEEPHCRCPAPPPQPAPPLATAALLAVSAVSPSPERRAVGITLRVASSRPDVRSFPPCLFMARWLISFSR